MTNTYCEALGIAVPSLAAVKHHPEANTYARMLVTLLEHGEAMTLEEVARRLEEAGLGDAEGALRSLKRCRPARPPVYRDGDAYSLDPHDKELDLWVFRLGLRPPKVPFLRVVPPPPKPLPGPETPIASAELEEAFRDAYLSSWSAQRLALAVLESHGCRMQATAVVDFLDRLTDHHTLETQAAQYWRKGAAVEVVEGGIWEVSPGHSALRSMRDAVRKRIEIARRYPRTFDGPSIEAHQRRLKAKRAANAEKLAELRRVLVHAFPTKAPAAVVLIDVAERAITTFLGQDLDSARSRLGEYDLIAAVGVRPLLRSLAFDPATRRLAELGPPQKTRTLNRRGRTLKITTKLLIQGSCGISRPFGSEAMLRKYLQNGQQDRLRRRLEADAKSLYALYQYGRLHGAVRLLWGFLDERLPVPWVYHDELRLYHLKEQAFENNRYLEVVAGNAAGWKDPWARAKRCTVEHLPDQYRYDLWDEMDFPVDDADVQIARIV
ncbi:MAG: hypothetical protein AAF657_25835 [Acidobacteriota bacterium]